MKNMSTQKDKFIEQNLGWLDRLIRFMIGTAILAGFFTAFSFYEDPVWLQGHEMPGWSYYTVLFSLYFYFTAVLGTDPIYKLFNVRSCGSSPRNPCGSFPFEVDAAVGHKPISDSDLEHSLAASHHVKGGQKRS